MFDDFRFFPEAASGLARETDAIYFYLTAVAIFFTALIALLILYFCVKYRRRHGNEWAPEVHGNVPLEVLWIAIPAALILFSFVWGTRVYFRNFQVPTDAGMQVYVTGKQWMWKLQHPTGHREINALHVPLGETVVLTMTSEDVIHSFYLPEFRIKHDVVPGMYTSVWFQPTVTGRFYIFCAEYCGAKHSEMVGEIVVMTPEDYEQWLAATPAGRTPVEVGAALYEKLRCGTCHDPGADVPSPPLGGLLGSRVPLEDGSEVVADAEYVREAILYPARHVRRGYEATMPSYEGQLTEEEVFQLVAYIETLRPGGSDAEGGGR